jgi:hypothetical protein
MNASTELSSNNTTNNVLSNSRTVELPKTESAQSNLVRFGNLIANHKNLLAKRSIKACLGA